MPAQSVARKLQNKAATIGFEWPDWKGPSEKVTEELEELLEAVENKHSPEEIQGEMGDILFAAVNLSRILGIDPEAALRQTNRKFDHRFRRMEEMSLDDGLAFEKLALEEQEAYWQKVKRERKN
jgi:ATP diphosphatase